jgi:hypothetical protein
MPFFLNQGDHPKSPRLTDGSCAGGLSHASLTWLLRVIFVFSPKFYKDKIGFYLAKVCKFFSLMLNVLAAIGTRLDLSVHM